MSLFFNGTNEFLRYSGAIAPNAPPLTMSCWFYPINLTAGHGLMWSGNGASETEFHAIIAQGNVAGDFFVCRTLNAADGKAITANAFNVNAWNHGIGIWTSTTDRKAILNGDIANKGTNADSKSVATTTRTAIGRFDDSSPGAYMNGRIAEAGIWNVALTEAEATILSKGFSPLFVRPESLLAYWQLIGHNDPGIDVIGNFGMAFTNTPAVSFHCPIIYPQGLIYDAAGSTPVSPAGGLYKRRFIIAVPG